MNNINYIGEHLLPGKIGHFFIVLGFVASLLATVAYFMATQRRNENSHIGWRQIGRWGFGVHGISVFAIIGTIFYIMIQQYYEYHYVWQHVSDDLPFKYIFSAFWEGQEGSFLLWMFWHVVLGFVLIINARKWESPILSVLSLIQVFIGTMILGLYFEFGDISFKIGSNPLLLLRDVMDAPIFAKADYVSLIDGNGLNPLLQNYWMTIHPPTLFLGFAATAVPFCYAVAGLWTNQHKEWLKPVMPWALFCGAVLGTGILMGGAWAYEALSFGGYWAWDPVENMSLVPWVILIAGIHTNLIARKTGFSIKTTYLFYLLSFVLIVYSTFLTRSGVLGDTSVHAFTEMGLEWQLIAFIATFLIFPLVLFFKRLKQIPVPKKINDSGETIEKEESASSKEFWMFIGTLVLLFSSALITASTSLPVYNKIVEFFDPTYQGGVIKDPVEHYNKYQLWIAVFIGFLTGVAQFLRYKEVNFSKYRKKFMVHITVAVVGAVLMTYLCTYWLEMYAWQYFVLMFAAWFGIVANLEYIIRILRGNLKAAESAIAHIGFGLLVVGTIASGLNKHHISTNSFAQMGLIEGFTEENYKRNILLMKGEPMFMSGYEVTYVQDTTWSFNREFKINYKKKDKDGNVTEEFNLKPHVLYDKSLTKIAASNPSTKRYWHKDVFTHIASLPKADMDKEYAKSLEDSLNYKTFEMALGDSAMLANCYAVLETVTRQPSHPDYKPMEGDLAVGVKLKFKDKGSDETWYAEPMLAVQAAMLYSFPVQIDDLLAKAKLPQEAFEQMYTPEGALDYKTFTLKKNQSFRFNGHEVRFTGFNPKPQHPDYIPEKGDIVVSAVLQVTSEDKTRKETIEPIYLIRNNKPFNIKQEISDLGLHFRFAKVDPKSETIDLMIAQHTPSANTIPIKIADNVLRTDYVVLEAIVFPGINLFWLGCVMIMLALLLSTFRRKKESHG